ncbi:MAG: hypothetical protein AB8C84_13310 [Oligoflexales bacterium]
MSSVFILRFYIIFLMPLACQQQVENHSKNSVHSPQENLDAIQNHDTDESKTTTPPLQKTEITAKDDYWNQKESFQTKTSNIDSNETLKTKTTCEDAGYFWSQASCLQNHLWFSWDNGRCLDQNLDRTANISTCDVIEDSQQFVAERRFRGGGHQIRTISQFCLAQKDDNSLHYAICDEEDSSQRFHITRLENSTGQFHIRSPHLSEELCLSGVNGVIEYEKCDEYSAFYIHHVLDIAE